MVLTILSWAGWIIAGALGLVGLFDKQRRNNEADDDKTASNLINNLRTTTELQEKELVSLRSKEVEQGKQIAHLEGQVKVLSEIFQGRDPATQAFLKEIPALVLGIKESNGMAKEQGKAIELLTNTMSSFLTTIMPYINGKRHDDAIKV